MGGLAISAGPAIKTAAEEKLSDALIGCLRLLGHIPEFAFIGPSASQSLAKPKAAPAKTFGLGSRVWCHPGTDDGYEAHVQDSPTMPGHICVRAVGSGYDGAVRAEEVVRFDVNHNQKRAFARGKTIQCKPAGGEWYDCRAPAWAPAAEYRVKPEPVDVNAALKQAFKVGARIECRQLPTYHNPTFNGRWHYTEVPGWRDGYEYRVQPPKRDYSVISATSEGFCIPRVAGARENALLVELEIERTDGKVTNVTLKEWN